jgi:hypothetical protein
MDQSMHFNITCTIYLILATSKKNSSQNVILQNKNENLPVLEWACECEDAWLVTLKCISTTKNVCHNVLKICKYTQEMIEIIFVFMKFVISIKHCECIWLE